MSSKKFIAEFIGTFALIFIGAGSVAINHMTGGTSGLTGIALAHGLTIAVMVSATMAVSGGHLNPAVTVALLCTRKTDLPSAISYIIAQCLGAISAAFLLRLCLPLSVLSAVNFGTPALAPEVTTSMGLLTEIILTFFLAFTVFGTAVDSRAPKMGGLFIGLTVALDIMVGGPLTGAAMNPARYIGPAIISGHLENCWLYWVGPIAGAVLAGVIYTKSVQ